jgi:hypothetical protein
MFRLAALSDARSSAELSEWLAARVPVEPQPDQLDGDRERLRAQLPADLHEATG